MQKINPAKYTISFIICLLLFIVACTDKPNAGNNPSSGSKIFKTYCVTCHGIEGNLKLNGAFDLTTSTLSLEERILIITNGRKTMTPYKGLLKPNEIKAVAEYTMKLK